MRRGPTFNELLDEQLGDVRDQPSVPRPAYRPAPVLGFFAFGPDLKATDVRYEQRQGAHFTPTHHAAAATTAPFGRITSTQRPDSRPESRPVPRAPRRVLSSVERRAFNELIALGATLDESFTADELRSVFRSLARRYHPDRHPHASAAERARLSGLFSRVHQAYKDLQEALPTAA